MESGDVPMSIVALSAIVFFGGLIVVVVCIYRSSIKE